MDIILGSFLGGWGHWRICHFR